MDPLKRKVLSDLFLAPSVVLPIVAGLSAGMLSWAGGGINYLSAAALVGILGGLGWMATRMIFKVEEITEQALQLQAKRKADAANAELDELARQLRLDGDPRTQDYLTLLRSLRSDFTQASDQPGLRQRSSQVRDQLDEVFHATIGRLKETLRLAKLADNLNSDARRMIMTEREAIMIEIRRTIEQLRATVSEFQAVVATDNRADLTTLREELEATLRAAKRTEERMREFDPQHSQDFLQDRESNERP